MCGRYVVISKISEIETRFGVVSLGEFTPNFNVSPGTYAPVITQKDPDKLQFFMFGLTPFWAKKKMYFINARAEGDFNPDNHLDYTGEKGIFSKPSFRKPIRNQRCLIIADAFIEGTTLRKLDEPFVVHLAKGRRPFAFAGVYDEWVDTQTGELLQSFAIITTTPNEVLQKLPHHRAPVILPVGREREWLNPNLTLSEISDFLQPYQGGDMNAYPIAPEIKNPRNNHADLLKPVGPPVM